MILDFKLLKKSLKGVLSNYRPLPDTSTLDNPNLYTMLFQKKFLTFYCVIFAMGLASTHLVK